MSENQKSFLIPEWDLPDGVHALTTTIFGGVSAAPYQTFNLAEHVGDLPEWVTINRGRLQDYLSPKVSIHWLEQTHSTNSVELNHHSSTHIQNCDASWTQAFNTACIVMTADCIPILLCSEDGQTLAAIHAGWKGALDGVIEQTIQQLPIEPSSLKAWIGPCIRQESFEVGEEVVAAFTEKSFRFNDFAEKNAAGKYQLDLVGIATEILLSLGVKSVSDSKLCTYQDERFFSYRKACHQGHEKGATGRIATLIWKTDENPVA